MSFRQFWLDLFHCQQRFSVCRYLLACHHSLRWGNYFENEALYGMAKYLATYISEIFTRMATRYNLRNSDFEIPRFNTIRYGKHTLGFQGPYIWSKLENSMRELPSLSIFKTNIRRVDLARLLEDTGNCCNLCST